MREALSSVPSGGGEPLPTFPWFCRHGDADLRLRIFFVYFVYFVVKRCFLSVAQGLAQVGASQIGTSEIGLPEIGSIEIGAS